MLKDDRVDLDIEDEDGKILEDMLGIDLPVPLPPHKIATANKIFKSARNRKDQTVTRKKNAQEIKLRFPHIIKL